MQLDRQLLFFFSVLGSFNGLFLASYFAFFVKNRTRETYFLSALMLVISIRILKSTFLFFYPQTSEYFFQIGLAACSLIGPFLYLYVKETLGYRFGKSWMIHIAAPVLIFIAFGMIYPYSRPNQAWNFFVFWVLYSQWLVYIFLSLLQVKEPLKAFIFRTRDLSDKEVWLINIIVGITIIWIAYRTASYTSYIVGALSFSFVFYLLILLWLFKRKKAFFFSDQYKYANRRIDRDLEKKISSQLEELFESDRLYANPDLKLSDVASKLNVSAHLLSQYLNDNLKSNFSAFVNEYRVNEAQKMMKTRHLLTLEAIGSECGFRSNSSFYASFKKLKGMTPAEFKKNFLE